MTDGLAILGGAAQLVVLVAVLLWLMLRSPR
jgi:hypothetical protein